MKRFMLLGLLLVAAACGGPNVVGKYTGAAEIPADQANNPMAAMAAQMMQNLSLDLRQDNTFSMNMGVSMDGTYTVQGDRVMLKTQKIMGMDVSEVAAQAKSQNLQGAANISQMTDVQFRIDGRGKKLTALDDRGEPTQLVFEKQ
jgi:hypothetical protein